jgi:hypothetical protein
MLSGGAIVASCATTAAPTSNTAAHAIIHFLFIVLVLLCWASFLLYPKQLDTQAN